MVKKFNFDVNKDVLVEIEINKSTNNVIFIFENSFEIKVTDDKNFKFDIKNSYQ